MRSKIFYDGNQNYSIRIFDSREQALACADTKDCAECRLFPSLNADIGFLCRGGFFGGSIPPEALRVVAFYFGMVAGWPIEEITVEDAEGKIRSLMLPKKQGNILVKTQICKDLFENITVFSSSAVHDAVLFTGKYPFVLVESAFPSAVHIGVAEGLRASKPIGNCPVLFASLSADALQMEAVRSKGIDDLVCLYVLSYLASIGHAAFGKEYKFREGAYCIESLFWGYSARALTPV